MMDDTLDFFRFLGGLLMALLFGIGIGIAYLAVTVWPVVLIIVAAVWTLRVMGVIG